MGSLAANLTFRTLSTVNAERANRWHQGFGYGTGDWTISDWYTATSGELGEAGNVIKKIRRMETGHPGANDLWVPGLYEALEAELADTAIYLDLLATYAGVNLAAAIVDKFNAVSVREGFPERLPND